jgi:hypothetical protein
MGWLHVALVHLNPMGEDDDDFEMNYLLDKHIQVERFLITWFCTTTFWHGDLAEGRY